MKYTLFIIFILIFLSCVSNQLNYELIGKWNYIDNEEYFLTFTEDSLIIKSVYTTKQNWTSDKSNIYLTNITDMELNKLDLKDFRNHFIYNLNDNNDTLVWIAKTDSTKTQYQFIKEK